MSKFQTWLRSLPGATDPDDLRLDTIPEIIPFIYVISGVLFFRALQVRGGELIASIVIGIILILGAIGARQMREYNFRIAWTWLVFTILLAVSIESFAFPDSPARYYFGAAIFATSLLTYGSNIIIVSFASLFAVVIISVIQGYGWINQEHVINPSALIFLLSLITFITSRHLHEELQRSRFRGGQIRDMLEQLRQQRVELDRTIKTLEVANVRIERMNDELVVARNAAETADRLKSEFLAHMSHELRTPLNAILNFTAFVADGLMGDVNEEQIDTLQKVMDSGNHLLSLINDILDISKIEAGMMNLFIEEIDLNTLLKGTISMTKGLLKNTPVDLVSEIEDDLPFIQGDKRRIRQVLLNLASNAVKFTPEGTITIRARRVDTEVEIAVQDTGVGIAPEDQEDVFEAFKQAKHDLQYVVGTGLGLPICKHFIEAHNGKIWLESEFGKGSTFFVTLPIDSKIETVIEDDVKPLVDLADINPLEDENVVEGSDSLPVTEMVSETEVLVEPEMNAGSDVLSDETLPVQEISDDQSLPEIEEVSTQIMPSPVDESPEEADFSNAEMRVLEVLREAKSIVDGVDEVISAFDPTDGQPNSEIPSSVLGEEEQTKVQESELDLSNEMDVETGEKHPKNPGIIL